MIYNKDFFNHNLKDNSVDLAIVDPPYGIGYKEWDNIDFTSFTYRWVEKVCRALKEEGTIWVFMGYENLFTWSGCEKGLVNILEEFGIVHLKNWSIWARQKGRGSSKHLKSQTEHVVHFTKSKDFTWNNLKTLRQVIVPYVKNGQPRGWFLDENGKRVRWTGLGNVWCYTAPFWKSKVDPSIHPAQKPLMLIERLLLISSNEGDHILDPFSGSGVVTRACIKHKRDYLSFEKDNDYYIKSLELIKREEQLSSFTLF